MQRVTLLFVAALLVSSGCNQQQRDVEGEIFIVLQNRETIRLSLTDVAVISPESGKAILSELCDRRQRAIKQPALQEISDKTALALLKIEQQYWGKLEEPMDQATAKLDEVERRFAAATGTAFNPRSPTISQERKQKIALLEEVIAHDSLEFRAANLLAPYASSQITFTPLFKTTTNAEGKFSVPRADDERILFVVISRKVFDKDEQYCWLVRLTSDATNVSLTNNNLVDTADAANIAREAFLHAPGEPQ